MSLEMQMTSTKCLVCNARNAKQHYGSWCCNGCKGFFWRTISSKRRYICLRNSVTSVGAILAKCEIEDGRRNSCRACRLKRCFEVGMDPNLIRDSWGKSTAALKQRNEQQSPINFEPDSPNAFLLEGSPVKSENHLVEMDEMHRRPRLPSSANSANSPISIQNSSKQNLQLLADYLEWIQTIPELKLFNEQDKNCLIMNRARSLGWLILASKHLNQQQIHQEQFGMEKLEALEAEIVNPLREMEVSKLELELLRLVCFFSTVPQMSADGKRMVQAIQSTYTRSLSEFSLKQSLQMEIGSLANVALRTSRIVHLLANVEKIAHQYD